MNPLLRGIIVVVVIAFLLWKFKSKWQGASDYSDGMREMAKKLKEQLPKFMEDSRYKKVKDYLDQKYKTTFEVPSDETTFQIEAVYFQSIKGNQMTVETLDAANPEYLIFLLKNKKEYLSATMTMASGEIHEEKLGAMTYNMCLQTYLNPEPTLQ